MSNKISRRDALKLSGAVGGLALSGGALAWDRLSPPAGLLNKNSLFQSLKPFDPNTPVALGEMRISLLGTSVIERRAQARSSVYVELGTAEDPQFNEAFVFDCGSGVVSNYAAMNLPWSKMSRIFLTHLHGDHTSDLTHVYCFGPQGDRKYPLFLWGPSPSQVRNPDYGLGSSSTQSNNPEFYDDGTLKFAYHFREMNRWHTESQSFVPTSYDKTIGDGYDIYATELDWQSGQSSHWSTNKVVQNPSEHDDLNDPWTAYLNTNTGVRISFFPAFHGRNGSISYRLDWYRQGLSMIFTGDTKPNKYLLYGGHDENPDPVDVYISEVVVDPDVWVARPSGMRPGDAHWDSGVLNAEAVQENSHTPQKAFGYILEHLRRNHKAPRLAVGTHFQAEDDTVALAMSAIRSWYAGPVVIASDLMVVRVTQDFVAPYRAVVSDYSWSAHWDRGLRGTEPPKYGSTFACDAYKPYGPMRQFSPDTLNMLIDPDDYDPTGWQVQLRQKTEACLNPAKARR